MDPMSLLALAGPLLGGKGGGTSSQSQATNTLTLNFDPTLVGVAGTGVTPTNGGASSTSSPDQTATNSQPAASNPLSGLYGTSYVPSNPLIGSPLPSQGISGNLSGSTLILLGGLALLMMMAMGGKHHHR